MELVKVPYNRPQQTSVDDLFKDALTDTYCTAANDGIAGVQLDMTLDWAGYRNNTTNELSVQQRHLFERQI